MREGEGRKSRRSAQPQKVPLPLVPWNDRKAKPKKIPKKAWHGRTTVIYLLQWNKARDRKEMKCSLVVKRTPIRHDTNIEAGLKATDWKKDVRAIRPKKNKKTVDK